MAATALGENLVVLPPVVSSIRHDDLSSCGEACRTIDNGNAERSIVSVVTEIMDRFWHYAGFRSDPEIRIDEHVGFVTGTDDPVPSPVNGNVTTSEIDDRHQHHYYENNDLRNIFALVDEDGDGNITMEDIKSFLQRSLGIDFCRANHKDSSIYVDNEAAEVVGSDDGSSSVNSNAVGYVGFVRLYESIIKRKTDGFSGSRVNDHQSASKITCKIDDDDEDLEAAFGVYDENGDGVISAGELASVLRRLGLLELPRRSFVGNSVRVTEEEEYCQALIDRFDRNGDGVIDLNEFSALLSSS